MPKYQWPQWRDVGIGLWSRAAERIFGYPAEEAIGQTVRTVPPEDVGEPEHGSGSRYRSTMMRSRVSWRRSAPGWVTCM